MDPIPLLEKLLLLSRQHFRRTLDEQWERWEEIAEQKRKLYEGLRMFDDISQNIEGAELFHQIQALEAKTVDALKEKKEETLFELKRIRGRKHAVSGYGAGQVPNASPGHFGFRC